MPHVRAPAVSLAPNPRCLLMWTLEGNGVAQVIGLLSYMKDLGCISSSWLFCRPSPGHCRYLRNKSANGNALCVALSVLLKQKVVATKVCVHSNWQFRKSFMCIICLSCLRSLMLLHYHRTKETIQVE